MQNYESMVSGFSNHNINRLVQDYFHVRALVQSLCSNPKFSHIPFQIKHRHMKFVLFSLIKDMICSYKNERDLCIKTTLKMDERKRKLSLNKIWKSQKDNFSVARHTLSSPSSLLLVFPLRTLTHLRWNLKNLSRGLNSPKPGLN